MLVYISDLPKLTEENMSDGPYALILAPTRELAQQIEQETLKFAAPMGFNCVSIVGGVRSILYYNNFFFDLMIIRKKFLFIIL